ncbi:hypothetical protein KA996_08190 [bacterium]|jgi:hypothetical protein|nr:hypothetical protein [bacterium]MDX9806324.1 hypothetical protein [bacterium]
MEIRKDDFFYEVDLNKEYEFDNIIIKKEGIVLKKEDGFLIQWDNVYSIKNGTIRCFIDEQWCFIEKDNRNSFKPMFENSPDIAKAFWDRMVVERFKEKGFIEGTVFQPESIFNRIRILEVFPSVLSFIAISIIFYFVFRNEDMYTIFLFSATPVIVFMLVAVKVYFNNRGRRYYSWRLDKNGIRLYKKFSETGVSYDIFKNKPAVNDLFFPKSLIIKLLFLSICKFDEDLLKDTYLIEKVKWIKNYLAKKNEKGELNAGN